MKTSEFNQFHKDTAEECLEICKAKQADYACPENTFKNFEVCEALSVCDAEVGIFVRFTDKVSRLGNVLFKTARVKEETVEDTIKDAINYLIILLAYLQYKKARRLKQGRKFVDDTQRKIDQEKRCHALASGQ